MTIRLLIVDDNPDLGKMLTTYFSKHDCEVEWLAHGRNTLERAIRFHPHVIVLDIMMPEFDGHAVYNQLRTSQRTSHIPILFLTALTSRDDVIAGLHLGAEDYIVKPFDFEELRLRVKNKYDRLQAESLTNAATGLPGRILLDDYIRQLPSGRGAGRIDCRLRGFDEFREVYGFLAADDALRLTANLMDDTLDEFDRPEAFIAHPGGAEFTLIVPGQANEIARRLVERFNRESHVCYSFVDRGRGYMVVREAQAGKPEKRAPLMTLSVSLRRL